MVLEQFGKAFDAHQAKEEDRPLVATFEVAGAPVNFYEPTGGQVMMIGIMASEFGRNDMEVVRDVGMLLIGLTDDEGAQHLRAALAHRSQPLDAKVLTKIVRRLVEKWTARPTEPQPASSPSGPTGGTSSTAKSRRVGKTSSTSRGTDSAT